MAMEGRICGAR